MLDLGISDGVRWKTEESVLNVGSMALDMTL